jgi:hypothetical protein
VNVITDLAHDAGRVLDAGENRFLVDASLESRTIAPPGRSDAEDLRPGSARPPHLAGGGSC